LPLRSNVLVDPFTAMVLNHPGHADQQDHDPTQGKPKARRSVAEILQALQFHDTSRGAGYSYRKVNEQGKKIGIATTQDPDIVEVDFSDPKLGYSGSNKKLSRENLKFLKELKAIAKELDQEGYTIDGSPTTEQRARIYEKALESIGAKRNIFKERREAKEGHQDYLDGIREIRRRGGLSLEELVNDADVQALKRNIEEGVDDEGEMNVQYLRELVAREDERRNPASGKYAREKRDEYEHEAWQQVRERHNQAARVPEMTARARTVQELRAERDRQQQRLETALEMARYRREGGANIDHVIEHPPLQEMKSQRENVQLESLIEDAMDGGDALSAKVLQDKETGRRLDREMELYRERGINYGPLHESLLDDLGDQDPSPDMVQRYAEYDPSDEEWEEDDEDYDDDDYEEDL